MNSLAPFTPSHDSQPARTLRAQLLSHFQQGQNADGGWPFHQAGESRVEPTCWALRAVADSDQSAQAHITRAVAFLQSQQLPDGSWPTTPWNTETAMPSGGWVTSLAASVLAPFLAQNLADEKSVHSALQWLCDDYPRDSSPWQKFLKNFASHRHESHNNEFRGWGWTPRTASWVEPTAFALMAFDSVAPHGSSASADAPGSSFEPRIPPQLAKQISDRRTLAIGLLYDRMCAGGGWNCGNPRVYGVDGDSLVLPTCWALLALRDATDHPHRALSLAWLQKSFATIASPGSLAVGQITLEAYGIPIPAAPRRLTDFSVADLAGQGTHIAAWISLALNPHRNWPLSSSTRLTAPRAHGSPVMSHRSPK
jgi:hypothetical protein